ncbi:MULTISPECIES: MBL fold metallo-hydrolase [unclassified Sinorhizobium]|uniref:MBL fold metallo-hydrolase n=1 Tax=unclassified Sinorhizobium TaxID=2613772 RepID=UPI0035233A13
MSFSLGSTMRILEPHSGVIAFYDGRIPGVRAYSDAPNWLDDGAFSLGCASYAIVDGTDALIYDTHISTAHAALIRAELERRGVRRLRVVLSHWHKDHIAGNAVFSDCEIIANELTLQALLHNRAAIEAANPPINPVVLPTTTFSQRMTLTIGTLTAELHQLDVHSFDGTVILVPQRDLLLAGDTLEDPVTYVAEPTRLACHLRALERLDGWSFSKILPNHGSMERIAAGGYDRQMIAATARYIERLLSLKEFPELAKLPLKSFAASSFDSKGVDYFAPYENVHRSNVRSMLEVFGKD